MTNSSPNPTPCNTLPAPLPLSTVPPGLPATSQPQLPPSAVAPALAVVGSLETVQPPTATADSASSAQSGPRQTINTPAFPSKLSVVSDPSSPGHEKLVPLRISSSPSAPIPAPIPSSSTPSNSAGLRLDTLAIADTDADTDTVATAVASADSVLYSPTSHQLYRSLSSSVHFHTTSSFGSFGSASPLLTSPPPVNLNVQVSLSKTYSGSNHQDIPMSDDIPYNVLKKLYTQNHLDNTASHATFPEVKNLNPFQKRRILVTGGAGFVGSHLVDRLMLMGHDVLCIDNYFTGNKNNIAQWIGHPNFELIRHDVIDPIMLEVDQIYHLACPASPVHYQSNPVKTLKTGFLGTYNMLGLAKRVKARILLASTSEIYGDPLEHPQKESYWGNVNIQGPRACYDESKRVGETLAYSYMMQEQVDVRVARIFNTYGPRMNWNDGRVVSNFILQALKNEDLTIYGDGRSTRSFQYVMDLVDGLIELMNCDAPTARDPVNIGNPEEYTIAQFAEKTIELVTSIAGKCKSRIVYLDPLVDDPHRRKPDTTRAMELLGWRPKWSVDDGMRETIEYFKWQVEFLSS